MKKLRLLTPISKENGKETSPFQISIFIICTFTTDRRTQRRNLKNENKAWYYNDKMIKKNIKTIGEKTHNATFRLGLY